MRTIEKTIVTGRVLDDLGGESKENPDGTITYTLKNERYLLERLKGKVERYFIKSHIELGKELRRW